MSVVVAVVPPDPIAMPEDIPGVTAGDATIAALIATATSVIDAPDGWVGRAFGPQTLELRLNGWDGQSYWLPFPPAISVLSVKYLDAERSWQTVGEEYWEMVENRLLIASSWRLPQLVQGRELDRVRIRYRAGYDGNPVDDGGTGALPPQVKQAVVLSVQHLRAIGIENLFLRAEEVDGIGRTEYTVSEQAGNIIRQAADRLLSGLRVYS